MAKFNFGEDEFSIPEVKTNEVQLDKVSIVQKTTSVEPGISSVPSGLTGTRGKKGAKLPTINMRFSEENYEYLKREGAIRGLTATAFTNWIIESYRSNPNHVHYNNDFRDTEGWD